MSPSDVRKIAKDRPKDVRAYDLYLKGREEYGRYSKESMGKALVLFQEAIAIDPNYALAWAGIADAHGQLIQQGWTKDRAEHQRLGLDAAEKSISSDPKLPDGYKAKALMLMTEGDDAGVRSALTKAIQADPTYTPALINLGVVNFAAADIAGTERMMRRAIEIDPQDTFARLWLGMLLTWTDRWDEALALADRIRGLSEEPVYVTGSYLLRIQVACLRGDVQEAARQLEASGKDKEYPGLLDPQRAYVAILNEQVEEGRQLLMTPPTSNNPVSHAFYVGAAFRVGQPELAEKAMDQVANLDILSIAARLDPKMHPLLDRKVMAPRKCDQTLVWPLQAPMIDETRFGLFKRVVVESARPTGSSILGSSPAID
jgi:Tfp pilus assembly protein PilF